MSYAIAREKIAVSISALLIGTILDLALYILFVMILSTIFLPGTGFNMILLYVFLFAMMAVPLFMLLALYSSLRLRLENMQAYVLSDIPSYIYWVLWILVNLILLLFNIVIFMQTYSGIALMNAYPPWIRISAPLGFLVIMEVAARKLGTARMMARFRF